MRHLLRITQSALTLLVSSYAVSAPRTTAAMRQAAMQALTKRSMHCAAAVQGVQPQLLRSTEAYSIYGYAEGGYAIVAADDMLPAVLGMSKKAYKPDGTNPGLRWYLEMVEQASSQAVAQNRPARIVKPDTDRFPAEVQPIVQSEWGQEEPYWNLCPMKNGERCVTGCVATAMAQILYTISTPDHGIGERTIYAGSTPVYANFGETTYDYANMLDRYRGVQYSSAEAEAVAVLMMHCGVASNMDYDPEGSGTYTEDAADGLVRYFGFDEAKQYNRSDYSEQEWMDIIYQELADGYAMYYSGVDGWMGGHAFVLDGYTEDGMVYINWGWNGDDNGPYNIALLDPSMYSFSYYQDLILGIHGQREPLIEDELTIESGKLSQLIAEDQRERYSGLVLHGTINSTDLGVLRQMAGVNTDGSRSKGNLSTLDLSDVRIVAGGEPFLTDADGSLTTTDDAVPERAFYGCRALSTLTLPPTITSIGVGAFAGCPRLTTLTIPEGDDKEYTLADDVLYDRDGQIISVLPSRTGVFQVEAGTETIGRYAFAGCTRLTEIRLPESVNTIADHAFDGCSELHAMRISARQLPETHVTALDGVNGSKTSLYVVAGTKDKYKSTAPWSIFYSNVSGAQYDNIIEFGTGITARDVNRYYGTPNPARYGYRISGDIPQGDPVITCDTNEETPVGDYPIHVERGTITNEVLELYDGTMHILPAILTATAIDATMYEGDEVPALEVSITGFKLDQTESVVTEMPVATTEATSASPVGDYPITVSGGEAPNYQWRYKSGTLHVLAVVTGIDQVTSDTAVDQPVYTIDGRRLGTSTSHLAPGIYIRGKRKVVIK